MCVCVSHEYVCVCECACVCLSVCVCALNAFLGGQTCFRPKPSLFSTTVVRRRFSKVQNSFHIEIAECPTFALQKIAAPQIAHFPKANLNF